MSQGPRLKLELFRCQNPLKGWGVRCKTDIQPGTFIADYLGEIMPETTVERRGLEKSDEYLFNMDAWTRSCACSSLTSLGLKTDLKKYPREYILNASTMTEQSLRDYFDEELIQQLSASGAIRRSQNPPKSIISSSYDSKETSTQSSPDSSWYGNYLTKRNKEWQEAVFALSDRVIMETEERGQSFTVDAR